MADASPLTALSDQLATLTDRAAASLVAVDSGGRWSTSGIHWRPGVIVTAEEGLVRNEDIAIALPGGGKTTATLAGRDPTTDIAVLRFDAGGLAAAELGDAASARVGQLVLAVGRHEDGPIAGLGVVGFAGGAWRSQRGGTIDNFIRLDLSLSRSAEGGALVDSEGRVLGMTVSGPRGRVLAIPRSTIDRTVDVLLAKGRIPRGYLGASLQAVRLGPRADNSEDQARGVLVGGLDPGGPASQAGLLVGDIITTWNASPVSRVREIMHWLGPDSVATTIKLQVLRGGTPTNLDIVIGERPAAPR